MRVRAGFIPQLNQDEIAYEQLTFTRDGRELTVDVPALTMEQIDSVIAKVTESRNAVLKNCTVAEIVEIVDQVIHRLLDRSNPYRQQAERLLPIVTGFDAEMICLGLTSYLKTFRKQQLLKFLVEDFANPMLLDGFQPRGQRRLCQSCRPAAHDPYLGGGNVPGGLPLWSLVSSLLVKGGSIGKVSSSEPLFAGWVAEVLADVEPKLKDCLAVVWWRGGDEEKEAQLFAASDVVLAYGGNAALSAMKAPCASDHTFLTLWA